jgi:radical SAM protein
MDSPPSARGAVPSGRPPSLLDVDFARAPFTVAWEITRACALACLHCRAEAQPRRDPRELTTDEGLRLIDEVAAMGTPVLVITGGDPLMRPDCFDFIAYARARGLQVGFSPSATGRLTPEALRRARDAGTHRLHLSLDGATAETHDRFRGVRGSFARTWQAIEAARELGLPLQIGTTVSRVNVHELAALAELVAASGAVMWSVFFLVPTGRAQQAQMLDAAEHERVMRWLAALADTAPYDVRTTAGMQFRRILAQRAAARGGPAHIAGAGFSFGSGSRPVRAVNDGDGFCFVSHTGDVCPSGFLQVPAGNVRERPLADIYRDAPLFRRLRDRSLLKGRCGVCEYRDVCGGSRARAWAVTGDELAEDPSCIWVPAARAQADAPPVQSRPGEPPPASVVPGGDAGRG